MNKLGVYGGLAASVFLMLALAGPGASTIRHSSGPSARLDSGIYTGIAEGGVDRMHSKGTNENADSVFSTSREAYRVRIDFTFTFAADGEIKGSGTGTFTTSTWNLSGKNGKKGNFDCDIPVTGKPFTVSVFGAPHLAPILDLDMYSDDAAEHNDAYDCGAGFSGYATDSTFIHDSIFRVLSHVKFDRSHPVLPVLTHDEETGDFGSDAYARDHDEWSISIALPGQTPTQPPSPAGGGGSGGGVPTGGGAALPGGDGPAGPTAGNLDACTIRGTAGKDSLHGTPQRDVICGLGGNDTIDGRGGDDIIYGGLGNDRITGGPGSDSLHGNAGNDNFVAHDGQVDYVSGDAGKDSARYDKTRDSLRGVEKKIP